MGNNTLKKYRKKIPSRKSTKPCNNIKSLSKNHKYIKTIKQKRRKMFSKKNLSRKVKRLALQKGGNVSSIHTLHNKLRYFMNYLLYPPAPLTETKLTILKKFISYLSYTCAFQTSDIFKLFLGANGNLIDIAQISEISEINDDLIVGGDFITYHSRLIDGVNRLVSDDEKLDGLTRLFPDIQRDDIGNILGHTITIRDDVYTDGIIPRTQEFLSSFIMEGPDTIKSFFFDCFNWCINETGFYVSLNQENLQNQMKSLIPEGQEITVQHCEDAYTYITTNPPPSTPPSNIVSAILISVYMYLDMFHSSEVGYLYWRANYGLEVGYNRSVLGLLLYLFKLPLPQNAFDGDRNILYITPGYNYHTLPRYETININQSFNFISEAKVPFNSLLQNSLPPLEGSWYIPITPLQRTEALERLSPIKVVTELLIEKGIQTYVGEAIYDALPKHIQTYNDHC